MKNQIILIAILLSSFSLSAQVAVNNDGSTADTTAALDIKSTSKGLLIPRMTTAQRTTISSPATGLLVFDITTNSFWFYDGSSWTTVGGSTATGSVFDTDNDTKIQVEESADEDIIRFDMAGTEFFRMDSGRLEVLNTGQSVFIGEGAGANDDLTFNNNVFIGWKAGCYNTEGSYNTANGYQSLYSNTTGDENTANGYQSLYSNTIGFYNTANGYRSLYSNTIGIGNIANGYQSLYSNTTGDKNTANGYQSLYSNTTGDKNTANGYQSLHSNTIGFYNTANGYQSLYSNTTGIGNIANGYQSLYSNTTGEYNIANGYQSLYSNTTGNNNIANGYQSLYYNTTGTINYANGYRSLYKNTTGYSNTANGYQSLFSNTTGSHNIANGYKSLYYNTTGYSNTANGYQSLFSNTTGHKNTAIGYRSLYSNTTGSYRTAVGNLANSLGSYDNSTGIGYNADPLAANKVRVGDASVIEIGGQVGWSTLSDKRFKTNVRQDEVKGLAFITRLQPITYNYDIDAYAKWKENQYGTPDTTEWRGKYDIEQIRFSGFMAQDVEKLAQEINYNFSGVCKPTSDKDTYSIRYSEFVVPLVKAVQEQQEIIETQNSELEDVKEKFENQNQELKELNSELNVLKAQMKLILEGIEK